MGSYVLNKRGKFGAKIFMHFWEIAIFVLGRFILIFDAPCTIVIFINFYLVSVLRTRRQSSWCALCRRRLNAVQTSEKVSLVNDRYCQQRTDHSRCLRLTYISADSHSCYNGFCCFYCWDSDAGRGDAHWMQSAARRAIRPNKPVACTQQTTDRRQSRVMGRRFVFNIRGTTNGPTHGRKPC